MKVIDLTLNDLENISKHSSEFIAFRLDAMFSILDTTLPKDICKLIISYLQTTFELRDSAVMTSSNFFKFLHLRYRLVYRHVWDQGLMEIKYHLQVLPNEKYGDHHYLLLREMFQWFSIPWQGTRKISSFGVHSKKVIKN